MNIQQFRQQFPQYEDMTDTDLAAALHAKHYQDIPKREFDKMFIGQPMHDDLGTAAVTAADSLELQKIDPTTKPVIVGTPQEVLALKRAGKIPRGNDLFLAVPGKAYVIDPKGVQAIYGGSMVGAIKKAKMDILKGNDSQLLGYPDRSKGNDTIAVTKQGEILTELPRISDAAKSGNLAYGAEGNPQEALAKASGIAESLRNNVPRKWKTIGKEIDNAESDNEDRQRTEDGNGQRTGQGERYGAEVQNGNVPEGEQGLKPAILINGQQLTGGDTHNEILDSHAMDRDEGQRGFQTPTG